MYISKNSNFAADMRKVYVIPMIEITLLSASLMQMATGSGEEHINPAPERHVAEEF